MHVDLLTVRIHGRQNGRRLKVINRKEADIQADC